MLKEEVDEAAFTNMLSGIKGIVLIDACGDAEKYKEKLERLGMGLPILETREIGTENVKRVIFDAIERATKAN